jgi:hypothetical protein
VLARASLGFTMNIFLLGLPNCGGDEVAEALTQDGSRWLVDTSDWHKDTFREQQSGEHIEQFNDEFQAHITQLLNTYPLSFIERVQRYIKDFDKRSVVPKPVVINGLISPKDFTHLFDYRTDVVIFLNRTDNEADGRDHESIAISCMRDYCFYLAAHNLLPKSRWLEYNFKMLGEEPELVKPLGSKNSVFIVKPFKRVLSHLQEILQTVQ